MHVLSLGDWVFAIAVILGFTWALLPRDRVR